MGLKPIIKRVWSPRGKRWVARVNHRFDWLYVYAFVHPHSGKTVWYLLPVVSTPAMQAVLDSFAVASGAGADKHVVLVLDNAGWHTSRDLMVPDGITLLFLPPYSPELQPAERLWDGVDAPLCNRSFEDLEELQRVVDAQCVRLMAQEAQIRGLTSFHWWPNC